MKKGEQIYRDARKEILLQGNQKKSLQPKKTLDPVSVETDPQR